MHPRNLHKNGYNFPELIETSPALSRFLRVNPIGRETINFADPDSVKALNLALLKHHYKIDFWDIPPGYLCPPVPGRADYIHAIADLIVEPNNDNSRLESSKSKKVIGLDIGTGANLIYPIIGKQVYDWEFVATDTDKSAVQSATLIQTANSALKDAVQLRHQQNPRDIFRGVIGRDDQFTFSMCNPPFHASKQAAMAGTQRKNNNLNKHQQKRNNKIGLQSSHASRSRQDALNFSGKSNELWCEGGEVGFIKRMINESV
ncbi:MAG: 23S rRNA (adenine1618-N6)-methyltransferase, partial [Glaciecola sp.]